jgi:NAD(P)-dependent dehydrogenase (short-subunit alcohol dehydrogenase family)
VNTVSPGPIETPAREKAAQFVTQVPLGRRGKPEELAAAVLFLASDEASYIAGVELAVDGGMSQV